MNKKDKFKTCKCEINKIYFNSQSRSTNKTYDLLDVNPLCISLSPMLSLVMQIVVVVFVDLESASSSSADRGSISGVGGNS